jgi:hypothetical protein
VVGTRIALVENASLGGAAVIADMSLGVGDSVPVKFHGQDVIGARIAWKRGRAIGLVFHEYAKF